jgi:hypothetical protein
VTGGAFLAAFLALPLMGSSLLWSRRFDWIPSLARLSVSGAAGAVLLCGEMLALTLLGRRWSLPILLVLPLTLIAAALYFRNRTVAYTSQGPDRGPLNVAPIFFLGLSAIGLGAVTFAAMTARVTSSDLLLFWAAKGEHFAIAGGIDAAFLGSPDHRLLHPDYPPLWPSLYAFATLVAGRFAWGAALATLPLFLLLAVAAIWPLARRRVGTPEASAFAALYVCLFGFLLAKTLTAGNADPALLYFETLALSLLMFARHERGSFLLTGIALAGATMLKVEGTAFSLATIVSCLLLIRPLPMRRISQLAAPPTAAFMAWLFFCKSRGLLDTLRLHKPVALSLERVALVAREVLSEASFGCVYLPWALVAFLILSRSTIRTSGFAILTATLVAAFDVAVYFTTTDDPTLWIGWSAQRTLLTPLLALFVAGIAPLSQQPAPDSLGFGSGAATNGAAA